MDEIKSALENYRKSGDPFEAVRKHARESAEQRMLRFLQSGIRDAMLHLTPNWNDSLEMLSEKIAVEKLALWRDTFSIAECERILLGISSEDRLLSR